MSAVTEAAAGPALAKAGPAHVTERTLLLPLFTGGADNESGAMISGAAEREIARGQAGVPFALARRMQGGTRDVIMAGIFGSGGPGGRGSREHRLRETL